MPTTTGEFSDDARRRAAEHGIDIERSYREFQLQIRHGRVGKLEMMLLLNETGATLADKLFAPGLLPPGGGLSAWERRVLTAYAAGLNGTDVAEVMRVTYESVRNATKSARHKLGARSKTHAVAIAIRRGIIQPPAR